MNYSNVSVIIRTRDIENRLQELLWRLFHQSLQPSELVVVDNFSSEKKLDEMESFLLLAKEKIFNSQIGLKLVSIRDGEFSYPYSANIGIVAAKNELICMTNGHSLPCLEKWLESGISHFSDSQMAGVGGYAIPHVNGSVWEKIAYNGWDRFSETSKFYARDNYFSTINCILRKSLWEQYPFNEKLLTEVPNAKKFGGEDYDWAVEMLSRGYKIVVDPRFNVYHSHKDSIMQLASKYFTWQIMRRKIRSLKRPRESYTRLAEITPTCCNL